MRCLCKLSKWSSPRCHNNCIVPLTGSESGAEMKSHRTQVHCAFRQHTWNVSQADISLRCLFAGCLIMLRVLRWSVYEIKTLPSNSQVIRREDDLWLLVVAGGRLKRKETCPRTARYACCFVYAVTVISVGGECWALSWLCAKWVACLEFRR